MKIDMLENSMKDFFPLSIFSLPPSYYILYCLIVQNMFVFSMKRYSYTPLTEESITLRVHIVETLDYNGRFSPKLTYPGKTETQNQLSSYKETFFHIGLPCTELL